MVHTFSNNYPFCYIGLDQAAGSLDEGSDVFFERTDTVENPFVFCLTMSHKDVKHVNWPSIEVLTLRVWKCETHCESAVMR